MFISDSYRQEGGGGKSFSTNSYTLGNNFTIHALYRDDKWPGTLRSLSRKRRMRTDEPKMGKVS